MDFKSLYSSYEPELKEVENAFLSLFQSQATLIATIGQYIVKGGGKRIRPLFLLASSDLFGYKGDNRILLASIIEAIHTASLLHDDVIDAANVRRGKPTAHSVWGNQIVVLTGDFLYSNALRLSVLQENQMIMEHLSSATTSMTEGELLQLNRVGQPDITEEEYLQIIASKTGSLISAACAIGGIISDAETRQIAALADFGMKTGMAFQMADDILDYAADQDAFGKKLGKDLEEGKITIPMIELLGVAHKSEKDELKAIISSHSEPHFQQRLKRVFDLLKKYDTINTSMNKAFRLIEDAKQQLDMFGPSYGKDALAVLADYALEREK